MCSIAAKVLATLASLLLIDITTSGMIIVAINRITRSNTPMLLSASIMLFGWCLVVYVYNSISFRSKTQISPQSGFLGWCVPVIFPIAIASWFEH